MFPLQTKSQISKTEWFFVIGASVVLDIVQWVGDFFAIGLAINPFLDIAIGACLMIYFPIRGVQLTTKRTISLVGSFLGEEATEGILPAWTFDVAYIWWDVRIQEAKESAEEAVKAQEIEAQKAAQIEESDRLLAEQKQAKLEQEQIMSKQPNESPQFNSKTESSPENIIPLNFNQGISDKREAA